MHMLFRALGALLFALIATPGLAAPLSDAERADMYAIAREVLAATDIPSASIAIVRDGELAYAQAYGFARLEGRVPATPQTRYAIGSISKQFTAASVLLLAEDGRLTLDDPLSRYDATLTRANDITLRRILNHSCGYRDYWPQDFVFPVMAQATTRAYILDHWARIPLDYEPGAEFRYSNTGYTIAAMIVERVSRRSLHDFETRRIFRPLRMTGVAEIDSGPLSDSAGYARFGLGPIVVATKEGRNWLTGAGELAMRPTDLAIWNISLMRGGLLRPESIQAMTTALPLTDNRSSNYGLGQFVRMSNGKRVWTHGGAVSGYLSDNSIYPDENLAITVLTNGDFAGAVNDIATRIAFRLREQPARIALIRDTLADFQAGRIDRSRFTDNGNALYAEDVVRTLASSLASLGPARLIEQSGTTRLRGGLTTEIYHVRFATRAADIVVRADPVTGKFEQFPVLFGAP